MKKSLKILLTTLVIGGLGVFVFFYLEGKTPLNNERKIKILFPDIEGLIEASPLLLNGYQVGAVTAISLQPDTSAYKVLVTFTLSSNINIPEKSEAMIFSQDLLNNKAVNLMLSDNTKLMGDNEVLVGYTEEGFKDKIVKEIQPLKDKATNLFTSFDSARSILSELKNTNMQRNLKTSFESINKSLKVLQTTGTRVDTIVGPDKSAISAIKRNINGINNNLQKNDAALTELFKNIDQLKSEETKKTVAGLMQKTDVAVSQAKDLMDFYKSGKGTVAQALKPDSVNANLDRVNRDLDLLLKDLKSNPDKYIHISVFAPKKVAVE